MVICSFLIRPLQRESGRALVMMIPMHRNYYGSLPCSESQKALPDPCRGQAINKNAGIGRHFYLSVTGLELVANANHKGERVNFQFAQLGTIHADIGIEVDFPHRRIQHDLVCYINVNAGFKRKADRV